MPKNLQDLGESAIMSYDLDVTWIANFTAIYRFHMLTHIEHLFDREYAPIGYYCCTRKQTVEAIKVAPIEEYGKVMVTDLGTWPVRKARVTSTRASWAEPSRAAIGHVRVDVVVEEAVAPRCDRHDRTAFIQPKAAVAPLPRRHATLIGAKVAAQSIAALWGLGGQSQPLPQ